MDKLPLVAKLTVFAVFALLLLNSGLRPGKGEPRAWYDRAIRGVGGILIFLLMVAMLLMTFGAFDRC